VEADNVDTSFKDGVLTVKLPKSAAARARINKSPFVRNKMGVCKRKMPLRERDVRIYKEEPTITIKTNLFPCILNNKWGAPNS
jgi:hypothetical protein